MGKIKKILENELVGGTQSTDVYPVTSVKAVYDEDNERLDHILNRRGVVNISTNYNSDHTAEVLTLEQAIAKVPSKDRVLGFQGKFLTSERWKSYMFTGDSVSSWSDISKWTELISSVGLAQELGDSTSKAISQNAVTKALKDSSEEINNKIIELDDKVSTQLPEIEGAKNEALNNIKKNEQSAITNFNSQRITPEMLSESTKQLIEASGGGTITNLADDEDLTSVDDGTGSNVLKFADRTYNANNFSGKGYKILRKNIRSVNIASTKINITEVPSTDGTLSFTINGKETQVAISATTDNTIALVSQKVATALQASMTEYDVSIDASLITLTRKSSGLVTPSVFSASTTGVVCTVTDSTKREFRNILTPDMINQSNTIYEIRYDFDLNNNKIELQENSILYFTTGSLKNGTLDCNNSVVLENVNINGIVDNIGNKEVDFSWFTNDDYFYENFKNTINSKKVKTINLENKTYNLKGYKQIIVDKSLCINGNNATFVFDTIQSYGCFSIKKTNNIEINDINVKLSPSNLTKEGTTFWIGDVTNVVLNNCKIETFGYCTSLWLHDNTKNITINDCIINRISENNDNNVGGAFWIQNYGDSEVRHITINNTIFNYRGTDEALAFWTHNKGSINEIIFNNCVLNVLENNIKQIMPISLTVYKELADSDLIFKQCTFNIFNSTDEFVVIRGRGTTGEQQYVKLDKKCLFENCNINTKNAVSSSYDDVEFYNSFIDCTSIQNYGKFYDCNIKLNHILSNKATFKKCNIESKENLDLYLISNSNHALDCIFDSCNISLSNQMLGLINFFNVKNIRFIFVNNIVYNVQGKVIRLVSCGEHITVSNNIFLNSDDAKIELYNSKNLIFSNNICTFSLNNISDEVNTNLNSIIFTNNTYIDTENNTKHFYLYGAAKYINSDANIKNPIKGMISIMENKDNALTYYDGSAWKTLFKDYGKGATNSRPTLTTTNEGFEYYDSTIKKKILWNGITWVNLDGNSLNIKKSGTTAERPANVEIGFIYKDTTLNKLIIWEGSKWVNLDGSELS